jgi:hypothetical protein
MMVSFLPWMSFFYVQQFLREGTHVQKMIFKAQPSYFAVSKWTPVTTINFFNNGRVIGLLDDGPPWTWLVGGVLFTAPVMLAFASLVWPSKLEPAYFHKRGTILLGILWLVPTAIVIFIAYALNFPYDVRYVSFCTSFLCWLRTALFIQVKLLHSLQTKLQRCPTPCCKSLSRVGLYYQFTLRQGPSSAMVSLSIRQDSPERQGYGR